MLSAFFSVVPVWPDVSDPVTDRDEDLDILIRDETRKSFHRTRLRWI
jgi:hypothetical protein